LPALSSAISSRWLEPPDWLVGDGSLGRPHPRRGAAAPQGRPRACPGWVGTLLKQCFSGVETPDKGCRVPPFGARPAPVGSSAGGKFARRDSTTCGPVASSTFCAPLKGSACATINRQRRLAVVVGTEVPSSHCSVSCSGTQPRPCRSPTGPGWEPVSVCVGRQ
jgi:hypothetical protein